MPKSNNKEKFNKLRAEYPFLAFDGFDYQKYFTLDTRAKLGMILEAQEHILGLDDGKNRDMKQVSLLSQAFALSVPNLKAVEIKDEVGFFQAIKARLTKFEPSGSGKSDAQKKCI